MYIQITTKCNMTCEHCCYGCNNGGGEHMDMSTFEIAAKLAYERGEGIFLGGGEPTLHPKFWEIIGISFKYCVGSEWKPGLVTNGSVTSTALQLATLAEADVLYVGLSQDIWHDAIDDKVVERFEKLNSIRSGANRYIYSVGSAREIDPYDYGVEEQEGCCCSEISVEPNGTIWGCGCKNRKLGTVEKPEIPMDWDCYECSKDQSC